MELKEIKQVELYKFTNDHGSQVNIYVEPIGKKGRLIIATHRRIYQRFFDGCNPDIHTFLSNQTTESIAGCFDEGDTTYVYLTSVLQVVWPKFQELLKTKISDGD